MRVPNKRWKPSQIAGGVDFILQEIPLWFIQYSVIQKKITSVYYPTTKLKETLDFVNQIAVVAERLEVHLPRMRQNYIEITNPSQISLSSNKLPEVNLSDN